MQLTRKLTCFVDVNSFKSTSSIRSSYRDGQQRYDLSSSCRRYVELSKSLRYVADSTIASLAAPPSPSSPLSFLNLPDEVLRLIFEFDYALGELKPPFHYTLNKRISVICLPFLHRHLVISKETKDAVLSSIISDQTRRNQLKSLALHFDRTVPLVTCKILTGLPLITSLTINLCHGDSFPTYLTDALRSFNTLRHLLLSARHRTPIEDETFRFSELPALQSLDLQHGCAMNALVDGTDRPIELTLDCSSSGREDEEREYTPLPWSSIRSLTLPVLDTFVVLSLGPRSEFWKSFVAALGKVSSSLARIRLAMFSSSFSIGYIRSTRRKLRRIGTYLSRSSA